MGAQLFIAGIGATCTGLLFFYVVLPIWRETAAWWQTYVETARRAKTDQIAGTPGRNAVERPVERPTGNPVPINRSALFARILSTLPDDEFIDTLAQMTNPDGSWRYAESRIGKFAPGRLEDRIEQVRRVRGTDALAKPATPTTPYAGRSYNPKQFREETV